MTGTDTDDQIDAVMAPPIATHAVDPFSVLANILAIVANPKLFRKQMREFQQAQETVTEGQAKLAADRAEFERSKALALEEIETQRTAAGAMWARAQRREDAVADREKRCREREDAAGLTRALQSKPVGFGTLTQAPDSEEIAAARARLRRMGPDGTAFAEGTTITHEPENGRAA